jgi:hypothetical protein
MANSKSPVRIRKDRCEFEKIGGDLTVVHCSPVTTRKVQLIRIDLATSPIARAHAHYVEYAPWCGSGAGVSGDGMRRSHEQRILGGEWALFWSNPKQASPVQFQPMLLLRLRG